MLLNIYWTSLTVFFFSLSLLLPSQTSAASDSDYKVRSTFILNFLKYTTWPNDRVNESVKICLVGNDGYYDAFRGLGRKSFLHRGHYHSISVEKFSNQNTHLVCNVFVFSKDLGFQLDEFSAVIAQNSSLSIGEGNAFFELGGIISFYTENGNVHFEINVKQAKEIGLHFSPQLLKLSKMRR